MDRRRFLLSAVPAVAATKAIAPAAVAETVEKPRAYVPTFFSSAEWRFLNAAVGRLIPSDGAGPGGLETGVPEFIDRQMELPYGHGSYWYMQGPFSDDAPATLGYQLRFPPREIYRLGIRAINEACTKTLGDSFVDLKSEQQDIVLRSLEQGTLVLTDLPARAFFEQLLANTREGYFADPQYGGNRDMASWKWIGFPGARADFTDWIDQAGKAYPYGPVSISGRSSS
ncbi:MAG: gluconate 2-dehydrogenase subunit 3 family protein [Burkholderiaceae bacterium]|jgi:gluconate 2-dehydrogenase gamma chain